MPRSARPCRHRAANPRVEVDPDWISLREGARLLGLHTDSFYRVLGAVKVRQLALPGLPPLYSREHLTQIRDASIIEAPPKRRPRKPRKAGGAA